MKNIRIFIWNFGLYKWCKVSSCGQRWLLTDCIEEQIYLSQRMTKPTKWHVRPGKTEISLGIRPVWSDSNERTAKTLIRLGGCPGWSEPSLGAYAILLVLSCAGSFESSLGAHVKSKFSQVVAHICIDKVHNSNIKIHFVLNQIDLSTYKNVNLGTKKNIEHMQVQSTLFKPTLDTTTKFAIMTNWMSRDLCPRGGS